MKQNCPFLWLLKCVISDNNTLLPPIQILLIDYYKNWQEQSRNLQHFFSLSLNLSYYNSAVLDVSVVPSSYYFSSNLLVSLCTTSITTMSLGGRRCCDAFVFIFLRLLASLTFRYYIRYYLTLHTILKKGKKSKL